MTHEQKGQLVILMFGFMAGLCTGGIWGCTHTAKLLASMRKSYEKIIDDLKR